MHWQFYVNDIYAKLCISDAVKNINIKAFNPTSRTNETREIQKGMKFVNVNVDQMQVFVITYNVRIMINPDVNVKN